MLKNRIQALLHQYDLERPKVTDIFGASGREWLENLRLPNPDGNILSEDLTLLEALKERVSSSEGLIKTLSQGDQKELRSSYERIKGRRGAKDARVATARKLAEIAWHVWTEERPYEAR